MTLALAIAIGSAVLRAILAGMVVFMLTHRELTDVFYRRERWGLGLMGGSGFMTIPVILDINKEGTPFDIVAGMAFSAGAVLFLWGFTDRKLGHARRNREAAKLAKRHLEPKGKL